VGLVKYDLCCDVLGRGDVAWSGDGVGAAKGGMFGVTDGRDDGSDDGSDEYPDMEEFKLDDKKEDCDRESDNVKILINIGNSLSFEPPFPSPNKNGKSSCLHPVDPVDDCRISDRRSCSDVYSSICNTYSLIG